MCHSIFCNAWKQKFQKLKRKMINTVIKNHYFFSKFLNPYFIKSSVVCLCKNWFGLFVKAWETRKTYTYTIPFFYNYGTQTTIFFKQEFIFIINYRRFIINYRDISYIYSDIMGISIFILNIFTFEISSNINLMS